MKILVIDGQGGKLGKTIIESVLSAFPEASVTAVGTNSAATSAMLKAGAEQAATGENSVKVGCRTADVIIGPLGIVIADSMLGEITPEMACAVAQSKAQKILIPSNRCGTFTAGINNAPISELVSDAMKKLSFIIENKG